MYLNFSCPIIFYTMWRYVWIEMKLKIKIMKNTRLTLLSIFFILLTACDRAEDFTAPSFIHIDGVKITAAQMNDIAYGDQNFYTSDVVGVYVVAHYPERMTVDTIGLLAYRQFLTVRETVAQ